MTSEFQGLEAVEASWALRLAFAWQALCEMLLNRSECEFGRVNPSSSVTPSGITAPRLRCCNMRWLRSLCKEAGVPPL